jgi:diketogulonate reductase-like aldo/keto reductase
MRSRDPRWQPGNYERNVAATAALTRLAEAKDAMVSQLALAWLLAQGDDIVPIPGTRSAARVTENVAAASVLLTADDLAEIGRILPNGVSARASRKARSRLGVNAGPLARRCRVVAGQGEVARVDRERYAGHL